MKVKVLVIRFSSIGDIILTSPVVRCIKNQLEGEVEIHFLTKNKFTSLLAESPYISKIWGIEKSTSEVYHELKNEEFDYIVDLHKNIRSKRIIKRLKCLSFSFDKANWQKWLMVHLKINRLPKKHLVDRYFEGLKAFGIENDGKGLDYFIPKAEEVDVKTTLPESFQKGYVAFAIGGTYFTKRLPDKKIVSIIQKLPFPVVLLGGNDVKEEAKKIKTLCGAKVFDACETFSLHQSASIIKQAEWVIAHDTGMMHMAAAFKKKIISVWGSTIPEFGMYPYLPKGEGVSEFLEMKDLKCRPCSKLGENSCPKKHFFCMNLIDEDEVNLIIEKHAKK